MSSIKLTDVDIFIQRWQITISGTDEHGDRVNYIASADSAYADSGIWFGTAEEMKEQDEGLW